MCCYETIVCTLVFLENWMNSVVVGLGVALGVCVAVMTLLIASHLKRSVCDHCKGKHCILSTAFVQTGSHFHNFTY